MTTATGTTPHAPPLTHAPPRASAPPRPVWWRALPARVWRVTPVMATVLLLCAPVDRTSITGSGEGTAADVASGVLVVWCVTRLLRERHLPVGRRLTPLAAVVLGAPAVAFAAATAASADPGGSLPGFVRYLQVFVLVPAAVLLSLRDARDFRLVCGAVVALALVQGVVGVVQNLTGTGASYMGENIRAVGTFGALDVMGMSTVVSAGLLTALALGLRCPPDAPRWLRPASFGCAAALVVPLVLSYSRGAWIATAVAGVVLLALNGLRTAVAALAALIAAGVVLVGGFGVGSQQVAQRAQSISTVSASPDRSVMDRYSLWSAAVDIWRDAPAVGVGIKGFPDHRDGHASLGLSSGSDTAGAGLAFQREPLLSPHNMYLLVLSEQGLLGVTALAGGWAALLVRGLRRLRDTRTGGPDTGGPGTGRGARGRPRDTGADCGLVAVGLLVWQSTDFLYSDIGGPSTVLTAVALGLVAWWALAPERAGAAR